MYNIPIGKFLKFEQKLHPRAQIVDYYKLVFQGWFGSGHYIPNLQKATDFLEEELLRSDSFEEHYIQQISPHYFRLNIRLVKEGIIPIQQFLSAFLNSTAKKPVTSEWIEFWFKLSFGLPDMLSLDSEEIKHFNKKLSEENYIFHHSEVYRNTYHPHYRLVRDIELLKNQTLKGFL